MSYAFQFLETFDGLSVGFHVGLGDVHGPRPPNAGTGAALFSVTSYTLGAGLDGTGKSLVAPVNAFFTYEAAHSYDGQGVGGLFKVGSLASVQSVFVFGSATSGLLALEINATTGTWRIRNLKTGTPTLATSVETTTPGAIPFVEACVYVHATLGAFEVRVNGFPLTWDSASTNVDTKRAAASTLMTGVNLNTTVGAYGPIYGHAGNGMFDETDFKGSPTRLPKASTLFPVSQGEYFGFLKDTGAAGDGSNYNRVDEATASVADYLKCNSVVVGLSKDSWIFSDIPAEAGEILAVQSSYLTNGGTDDERHDSHFYRKGGIDYTNGDDLLHEWLGVNPQFKWSARYWQTGSGRGWLASDLIESEWGIANLATASPMQIAQARVMVLWLAPLPVTETPTIADVEAECAPCTDAVAARYLDSFLEYDGRNTTATTLTLTLAPASDWTTVGATHGITASAGIFAVSMEGKAFRVGDPEADFVIFDIVTYINSSSMTGTIRAAVPLSLQAVSTLTWALMVDSVSGLDHLEGEAVGAVFDGVPVTGLTVDAGSVAFSTHGAVIAVGLEILSELETLDVDFPGVAVPVSKRQGMINKVFVLLNKSRSLRVADADMAGNAAEFMVLNSTEQQQEPNLLKTEKLECTVESKWGQNKRVRIIHTKAEPLTINAIEVDVTLGGS